MFKISFIILLFLVSNCCCASEHAIAITIDDLPYVGNKIDEGNIRRADERFMQIVQALIDQQVPATGFVIAGAISKRQWPLLEFFRKEGFGLGNHTYSHVNLSRVSSKKYIQEIAKADKILAPIMTQPKYFRYPYLAEGNGNARTDIQDYLTSNQYLVAPVTIDSQDYRFNARLLKIPWQIRGQYLEQIKKQYLEYVWQQTLLAEKRSHGVTKQILLIHANLLNSYFLRDIIHMYQNNGYHFISLNEALTSHTLTNLSNNTLTEASDWLPTLENVW